MTTFDDRLWEDLARHHGAALAQMDSRSTAAPAAALRSGLRPPAGVRRTMTIAFVGAALLVGGAAAYALVRDANGVTATETATAPKGGPTSPTATLPDLVPPSEAVARTRILGSQLLVAPLRRGPGALGRSFATGILCLAVIHVDRTGSATCADAMSVLTRGAMLAERTGTGYRGWGYVPAGTVQVIVSGRIVPLSMRFFETPLPSPMTGVTLINRSGLRSVLVSAGS
jgi:hypothetical protein